MVKQVDAAPDDWEHENDLAAYALTAIIVFLAALGVSGGSHLWLILTRHPLIKEHKATLEFRSAVIGDGLILPFVSVLMMRGLRAWRARPGRRSVISSLLAGVLFTSAVHVGQVRNKMTNWTMPQPGKWNALGIYHMGYMASQFAFTSFYWQEAYRAWRSGKLNDAQKRELALIMGGLVFLSVLVQTDYQD